MSLRNGRLTSNMWMTLAARLDMIVVYTYVHSGVYRYTGIPA
jgi:hypothetical protein